MIRFTHRSPTGESVGVAGRLANGNRLFVIADSGDSDALAVFASIDLLDTNGTPIDAENRANKPAIVAPTTSGIVMLDDNTVYRVRNSSDLRTVAMWSVADHVASHSATAFPQYISTPFFLTKVGEWKSVPAEFVGTAKRQQVTSVMPSPIGAASIVLSDGSKWTVLFGGVTDWKPGEDVGLVTISSGFQIVRLSDGSVSDVIRG